MSSTDFQTIVRGLSTAVLADGLAISLLSTEGWNVASVRIEKSWIAGEDVETRTLDVLHAGRTAHLEDPSVNRALFNVDLLADLMSMSIQAEHLAARAEVRPADRRAADTSP